MNTYFKTTGNELSDRLKSIITHNNKGVNSHENGQLEQALKSLRNAITELNMLKVFLHNNDECFAHDINNNYQSPQQQESGLKRKQQQLIKGWSQQPLSMKNSSRQSGNYAVAFTRAIYLRENDEIFLNDDDIDAISLVLSLDVLTIALEYNTSLMNHLLSDSQGQLSAAVDDAYHGYEQTFLICKEMNTSLCYVSVDNLKILILALFNNMGVLYFNNMSRFQDAAQCFRASKNQLSCLGKKLLEQGILSPSEINELSMNLWAVPLTSTAAA